VVNCSMKVVVTGASGFLGRILVDVLRERGVVVAGVSRSRIPGLTHIESYGEAPSGDVLVHLAEASDRAYAQVHAPYYEQEAISALNVLLEKRFSRVIYASSAAVYGDQCRSPRKIGDPVSASDAYTRLKLASEKLVLQQNGVVARISNLYGPRMAEKNVFSAIIKQLPDSGPIRIRDSSPVRDFLWVGDAAQALADMVTGRACGCFNVGSGVGVSIHDLASEVLSVAGQVGRQVISYNPTSPFSSLVVDITGVESSFGWRPKVELRQGITALMKMQA
jgi:UDP-glucose 4-epimerase